MTTRTEHRRDAPAPAHRLTHDEAGAIAIPAGDLVHAFAEGLFGTPHHDPASATGTTVRNTTTPATTVDEASLGQSPSDHGSPAKLPG